MSQGPVPAPTQPQMGAYEPSPTRAVSKAALAVAVFLTFLIIGLIYLYIFVYSGFPTDPAKYWWAGLTGFIFAFIFFWVHAATHEDPITRVLKWLFFILGAVFFYASILLSGWEASSTFLWLIVLSVIVLIVMLFSWRAEAQRAADEDRRARRHRT